jgi:hypothetical protein
MQWKQQRTAAVFKHGSNSNKKGAPMNVSDISGSNKAMAEDSDEFMIMAAKGAATLK